MKSIISQPVLGSFLIMSRDFFSKSFNYEHIDRDIGWRSETISKRANDGLKLSKKKIPSPCPVCENYHEHKFIQKIYGFTYIRCNVCSLVYLKEIPNTEFLKDIYVSNQEEMEKSPGDDLIITDDFNVRMEMISTPKVEFALREAKLKTPKWVDIGCGVGDLVKAATNLGCYAVGYDIDEREILHGQNNSSNIHCIDVNPDNAERYIGDADLISVISVLEHVPNCVELLKMLVKNSKNEAYYLIEVPRYNSISSLVNINFKHQVSRHMLPPNHVMLFSEKSFDTMLGKAGLQRVASWYYGMDINELFGTLLLNAEHSFIETTELKRLMNEFQAMLDRSKLCDEMLVLCKRF